MTVRIPVFAAAAAAACLTPAGPAAGAQRTAKLQHSVNVRGGPGGKVVGRIRARRPLTGTPTVVPVVATKAAAGRTWLRVRLPRRPNGATGWIAADGTIAGEAPWRVVVDRSRRRAAAYLRGHPVRRFRVVVGRRST